MRMTIKNNIVYVFTTIILSLLFYNVLLYAAEIHVPADRATIQAGIDVAQNGDTVIVANGIYTGEGNVNIDFKGKQIAVKSQNGAKLTIVDCEGNPDTRGFIFQNNETNDSLLEGFTIINGIHEMGGGIFCDNASPTIKNCVIDSNQATADKSNGPGGGGIYCLNSAAVILESTITNNIAKYGAGVFFEGCLEKLEKDDDPTEPCQDISLVNCIISYNIGDGIYCYRGVRPDIRDCTVSHNEWRGIAYNYAVYANKPIFNCVIEHNSSGGVSSTQYCIMYIEKSIIKDNTARRGAGIYCGTASSVYVSYCVIAENVATHTGGGIEVKSSRGDATIEFCTITRNRANEEGGGLFVRTGTSFVLSNSIVWGNDADINHSEAFIAQQFFGRITVKSNDINGRIEDIVLFFQPEVVTIENNIREDPLFIDAEGGNFRVKPNSPAYAIGAHLILDGLVSVSSVGKQVTLWGDIKRQR
ncbi:MAG: right-handed parallel beta-helix repeat-containing protein [Candidatus Poribacteria bacterium]|nr:right-handed parallel beta-helix repeat-containing protein [Candidatus Poribacteria bacterium]